MQSSFYRQKFNDEFFKKSSGVVKSSIWLTNFELWEREMWEKLEPKEANYTYLRIIIIILKC